MIFSSAAQRTYGRRRRAREGSQSSYGAARVRVRRCGVRKAASSGRGGTLASRARAPPQRPLMPLSARFGRPAGAVSDALWRALALAVPARTHRRSRAVAPPMAPRVAASVPDDRCAHPRRPGVIEGVRRACPDALVCSGPSGAGQSGRAAGPASRVRMSSMAARSAGSRSGHSPAYTSRVSTALAWPRAACTVLTDSPAAISALA